MSWLISRALMEDYANSRSLPGLVEEFLGASCSGGEPLPPLSGSPMPRAFLSPDRMTAFCRLSRFGMTFKLLTDDIFEDALMWFLGGFHVRTLASQGKAQELTANAPECGDTWRGSLARFDPVSCSWKTAQLSLLEDSEQCSVTWPRSGMTANGQCWELPMLGRRTSATGSGSLLPTPTAQPMGSNTHMRALGTTTMERYKQWPTPQAHKTTRSGCLVNADGTPWDGISKPHSATTGRPVTSALADAVAFWPTPTVCGNYNRKGASATSGDGLATAVRMWPTPTCQDAKNNGAPSQMERNTKPLNAEIGGPLNPTWVEWLMGWPLGWTDLKPLETDKSRNVQQQLGECLEACK